MPKVKINILDPVKNFFSVHFFSRYDRYFYRELMPNFFFGLAFFTAIIMLNQLFVMAKYYFEYNVPFNQVLLMFATLFPFLISFSLPFSILPAYLLTMGRFSQDSEIVAFKSCGISTMRIIRPGLTFGLLISLFAIGFKNYVEMPANYNYAKVRAKIMSQKPVVEFKEKAFLDMGGFKLSFDRMETVNDTDILYNLYVVDLSGRKVIQAEKGRLYSDPENPEHYILKFMDGSMSEIVSSKDPDGRTVEHSFYSSFDYLSINAFIPLDKEYYTKGPEMMSISELRSNIGVTSEKSRTKLDELRETERGILGQLSRQKKNFQASLAGLSEEEIKIKTEQYERERARLETALKNARKSMWDYWRALPLGNMAKYQDKFAMPLSAFVFALLSLSIGMYTSRSGRGEGLGIAVIIMLLFFGFKFAMESLITKSSLSPVLTWAPDGVFFIAGVILLVKKLRT